MRTEIRTITPTIARELLQRNTGNRKLTESHVDFLAAEMKKGNWVFDGQPIRLTEGGALLDGQHRLNAIIKANVASEFLVVTGVPLESFKVMDTGKSRSASDVLSIKGYEHYSTIAAAAKFLIYHNAGNNSDGSATGGTNKISNSSILEFVEKTPEITELAPEATKLYKAFAKITPSSHILSYRYLFNQKDSVKSKEFWYQVCYGLGLEASSPTKLLRDKLTKDKLSKASLPSREKKALIIKAWNAFRLGRTLHFLRWNKDNEPFPEIL